MTLDGTLEETKGQGLPAELWHFAIAQRFGSDPEAVRTEWSAETVEEALAIIRAEQRYRSRHGSE